MWTLLKKVAMVQGWTRPDKVLDFDENQWNAIIPDQIKQIYAALLIKHNLSKRQVCFKNSNDLQRTAMPMRCSTNNAAASSIVHITHENLPTVSNKGAQNKQSSDNDQHQDGHPHNDDTKNHNQESNNCDPCDNKACNAACQDAYAYGYTVGQWAGSSLNFANIHKGDCDHATTLVSDDEDESIDDKYNDKGNFNDAFDNNYAGQEDY